MAENQNNQDSFAGMDPAALRAMREDAISYASSMDDSADAMNSMTRAMSKMARESDLNSKSFVDFLGAARDITEEFKDQEDLLKKINEGELGLSDVKKIQEKAQEKINRLLTKADKAKQALADAEEDGILSAEKRAKLENQIVNSTSEASKLSENMATASEQAEKGNSGAANALGTMSTLFGAMKWGKAATATKTMAKFMRIAKIAGAGFATAMRAALAAALANPYVLIAAAVLAVIVAMKELVKIGLKVNQEVTEIGRAFGVGAEQAREIRSHYVGMAKSIGELGIEYTHLLKAQGALQDSLGTSAQAISQDIVEGMAMMIERMHLSTEAAVGFGKAALANNMTVRELNLQVVDNILANQKSTGVMLQGKKIMEETAKVGGALRGIYGANLDAISKSVIKAQMLGKTLGQVAKESKSMLDFQSSIEKEMEAELFLGKQLNLERARLAALTGDYDTYMQEITANAGDFHEFSKLNVLQQEKLAAALGMSSDSLADMLLQEANLEELKEKARAEGRDDLLRQYEQMSLNEQWAATVEKLKKMMINIVAGVEKLLGWIPGLMEGVAQGSDAIIGQYSSANVQVVGGVDKPMMYDGVEKYDSLGRMVSKQYYPKDMHWYSGTMPGSEKNKKNEPLEANISVTTRTSDMNYAMRRQIHSTKF